MALEKPLPPWAYRTLSGAAGFAIGFDSAPEPSSAGVLIKTLLGTWIMVIFLVFDIAYYSSLAMRGRWPRVGVRVLGVLDHRHLVDGACSFVALVPIRNGLSAILLMGKAPVAQTTGLPLSFRLRQAASAAIATICRSTTATIPSIAVTISAIYAEVPLEAQP